MYLCSFTIFFFNLLSSILSDRCCKIADRDSPVYKLLKSNSRSTIHIIARREVSSFEKCKEFAISKKALAFNYREMIINSNHRVDHWKDSNCQALECPELRGFSRLVNDTGFNYYSTYSARLSKNFQINAGAGFKCVPRVGVFYISEDYANYTNARIACFKMRGTLAHIISEERTEGLGKFVNQVPTFVGLSNRDKERQWKNEFDEPLSCFDYRGWAMREPSHSRGCVGLSNPSEKSQSSPTWQVLPCSRKSPYICEISPRIQQKSAQRGMKNEW